MTTTNQDKQLEILDAIYEDAALVDAEHGKSTPADQKWAREIRSNVHARLAEMRRNLMPAAAPAKKAKPISASLLAMGRAALERLLERLTEKMGGGVQYAHRHLGELSDDDLRRLIDTLDPNAADSE